MRAPGVLIAGLALTAVLAVAGLAVGPLAVPPDRLLAAAFGGGDPTAQTALALRAARVLAGLAVGAALAAAGATYQGVFRNPLAAPDLLGVSAGAALGAALALLVSAPPVAVAACAFVGGLGVVMLALTCARASRHADAVLALILCGVAAGALASAGLALILWLADPYAQLPAITHWLLGSLARARLAEAAGALAVALLCVAGLWMRAARLDALALGEEQARGLGVDATRERRLAIALATLAVAAATALSGVVGWIGLLAPHAARLVVGERARLLVPASALVGAALVLALDLMARLLGPVEAPLGVLAAAVGAPGFLLLFLRMGRR